MMKKVFTETPPHPFQKHGQPGFGNGPMAGPPASFFRRAARANELPVRRKWPEGYEDRSNLGPPEKEGR